MNLIIKFTIILGFLIITCTSNIVVDEPIKICEDGDRVDFQNSCKYKDPACLEELALVKEHQDFMDYYFERKGFLFHSLMDVVYTVKCDAIVSEFHLPLYDGGIYVNIPVTFINSMGVNTSGYLTQYELITLTQPKTTRLKGSIYEFTLPSNERQVVKYNEQHSYQIKVEALSFNKKSLEFFDYGSYANVFYDNYIKTNSNWNIFRDFYCLFGFIFRFFVYFNPLTLKKLLKWLQSRGYERIFLKQKEENREITWETIDRKINEALSSHLKKESAGAPIVIDIHEDPMQESALKERILKNRLKKEELLIEFAKLGIQPKSSIKKDLAQELLDIIG